MASVEAFIDLIPERLIQGYIARLGDFGSFNITLCSEGAATADKFTMAMIKATISISDLVK